MASAPSVASNLSSLQPQNATMFQDSDEEEDNRETEATNLSADVEELEEMAGHDDLPPTDRYGFYLDAGKQAVALPQEEFQRRARREVLREKKWAKMMGRWAYTIHERKAKLKRRIRKGVPDKLRGEVWDVLARVPHLAREHRAGRYADLVADAAEQAQVEAAEEEAAAADEAAGRTSRGARGVGGGRRSSSFEAIEKDLGRTFPGHAMFSTRRSTVSRHQRKSAGESGASAGGGGGGGGGGHAEDDSSAEQGNEPLGLKRLRNVLRAYALYDEEVGYCQGMSFFVAMFLIYRPPPDDHAAAAAATLGNRAASSPSRGPGPVLDEGEERAFWQLVGVMWRPESGIRGLYLSDMKASLEKMNTMSALCAIHLPSIFQHFEEEQIQFTMFATSWYMTLFSSSFPFDLVARVWDAFLGEGFKVIHRVALSLLKCFEAELLARPFEDLIGFLQHDLPNAVDPDVVMDTAFKLKLTKKEIDRIEIEYRKSQDGGRR